MGDSFVPPEVFELPAEVVDSTLDWIASSEYAVGKVTQLDPTPDTEEWAGASSDGCTAVRSGPDVGKVLLTTLLNTARGTKIAVFLGCFVSEVEAENVSSAFFCCLSELYAGSPAATTVLRSHSSPETMRTREQLRTTLCPCEHCGKPRCGLRCGACKSAFYCCKEHQQLGWPAHKQQCKLARKSRKSAKSDVKHHESERRAEVDKLGAAERRDAGTATEAQIAEARGLVAQLADASAEVVVGILPKFEDDAMWDAGVAAGLLPALVTLMARDKGACAYKAKAFFSQFVVMTLLHGAVRVAGRFGGVNCPRAIELLVRTEGAWMTLLQCIEALTAQAVDPSVARRCQPGMMNTVCRDMLRFVNQLMAAENVGRPLAEHFAMESAPVLCRLLRKLNLEERLQALDPGNAMEGLANQLAGLFHCWCERESKSKAKKFHSKLKLEPMQAMMYKMMALSSARAMIDKGGNLTNEEFAAACR